jgi:hypothetical protein
MDPNKTVTVKELIEALQKLHADNRPVQVWLPGTYINLGLPFLLAGNNTGKVMIEGHHADE